MAYDVVQAVREGKGRFEWAEVESEHNGHKLRVQVFRDALKFDDVPAMTWDFKPPVPDDYRVFDGVRLPASAQQLQQIADMLGCLLLTPKVVDMIWLQAVLKFNSVVNVKGNIVAISKINDVHEAIEAVIEKLGGDPGNVLVSCVGKYWVLINALLPERNVHGAPVCCNYGWCGTNASGPGLTAGVKCWQRPGYQHNFLHWDPSQTIRLMYKWAKLMRAGTDVWEDVLLAELLQDEELAPLASHEGVLKLVRQPGVPVEEELALYMPVVEIVGDPSGPIA